jgi:hypothetical protein
MGKVGSRTVFESLRAAAIPNPVLAVHFLSADVERYRESRQKRAPHSPVSYHLLLGRSLGKRIRRNADWPCKIVSLVRDPIAFAISNLFQTPTHAKANIETADGRLDPERTRQYLEQRFRQGGGTNYIDHWFDRELRRVFGIDVFATPFPVDRGYAVYRRGRVEALVIRLEDLSTQGPRVLAEFLDLEQPLELKRSNSRSESQDAEGYAEVLRSIRLDEPGCRRMYACRIAKHFYGPELIEQFIAHWTRADQRTTSAA